MPLWFLPFILTGNNSRFTYSFSFKNKAPYETKIKNNRNHSSVRKAYIFLALAAVKGISRVEFPVGSMENENRTNDLAISGLYSLSLSLSLSLSISLSLLSHLPLTLL